MDVIKFITGLFRPRQDPKPAQSIEPEVEPEDEEEWDERFFEESCRKRDHFWSRIGVVENDVLAPLVSPSFSGGPEWPTTRQAYRVIRRENTIVIATDGLSDPFSDVSGMGNGFGLELFLETSDIDPAHGGRAGDISKIGESWAFEILRNVAGSVADAGGINAQLDRHSVLSMEVPGVSQSTAVQAQVPSRFISQDDCIGVLLGGPKQDFATDIADMPLSPVRIVPITIITSAELERIRNEGASARIALAEKLAQSGAANISSFNRPEMF